MTSLQVRLRPADFDAGFQARDYRQDGPSGRVRRERFRIKRQGCPDIRAGVSQICRHYTENRVSGAVKADGLSQDVRIGAESAAPQGLIEKRDVVPTLLAFRRQERPTDNRLHAQHREESGGDVGDADARRLVDPSKIRARAPSKSADLLEHLVSIFPGDEVGADDG